MPHHLLVLGVATPLGFGLGPRVLVDDARVLGADAVDDRRRQGWGK